MKQADDSEGEVRVRDFTYYPLNENQCAFRIEGTHRKRGTYHQCWRYPRVGIQGYQFCLRHAEVVRSKVGD